MGVEVASRVVVISMGVEVACKVGVAATDVVIASVVGTIVVVRVDTLVEVPIVSPQASNIKSNIIAIRIIATRGGNFG